MEKVDLFLQGFFQIATSVLQEHTTLLCDILSWKRKDFFFFPANHLHAQLSVPYLA